MTLEKYCSITNTLLVCEEKGDVFVVYIRNATFRSRHASEKSSYTELQGHGATIQQARSDFMIQLRGMEMAVKGGHLELPVALGCGINFHLKFRTEKPMLRHVKEARDVFYFACVVARCIFLRRRPWHDWASRMPCLLHLLGAPNSH